MAAWTNTSQSSAETAMRLIDEQIEHQLSSTRQWKFERNAETRICQLPTEILCHIFLLTRRAYEDAADTTPNPHKRLPHQFLWIFVTTHVCRHWRSVAINEPVLWTSPALFLRNLGRLMLERSRMAGLSIEIDHTLIEKDSMDVVLQHISHTKKFHILNGSPRGWKKLFSQLPSAAPMLETLIFRYDVGPYNFTGGADARVVVPTSLLRDVTSLRELTLKGMSIQDWNSPLFDHITSLALDNIPEDRRPSLAQFKAMLSRMPQLVDLVLGDACPSSEGSQELVHLPNLRTLNVGLSAHQIEGFYSIVAVPPKLEAIKTMLLYRPEINFIDMFAIAKRAHLLDKSNSDGLCLGISNPPGGVAFDVTLDTSLSDDENDDDGDDYDRNSAVILIQSSWIHYSSTREATAHQHMFTGIMTGLDWTNLETLSINFNSLTPEVLRSSIGSLPRLTGVNLHGKVAVPFINALHSGWDIVSEIEPGSLAFGKLMTISFYQVEFSLDEKDADKDTLALELLQKCLMGRCERGAAVDFVVIMLCEGICEDDVDELSDLVPHISWDGEELGFCSDDESSE